MSTVNSFWDKYSQLINVSEGDHTLEEVLSAVSKSVNKVWILCNEKNLVYSISFAEPKYSVLGRILPTIKEYDFNYITKIGSYHSHEYSDVTKSLVVYFKDCSVEPVRALPLDNSSRKKTFNTVPTRRTRGVTTSMSAFGSGEPESDKVINDHINNHGKLISKIPDSNKKIFRLLEKVVSTAK